jgi:hypothetical protein
LTRTEASEYLLLSSRTDRDPQEDPMDLSKLHKGDRIVVREAGITRERIVVRVVDLDGARGGLVDTRPVYGRYSRSSGFVLGDEIVEVLS